MVKDSFISASLAIPDVSATQKLTADDYSNSVLSRTNLSNAPSDLVPRRGSLSLNVNLFDDPVHIYGNVESMKLLVNDREVVLPKGVVTVRNESLDEVIAINGSELKKALRFDVRAADSQNIAAWHLTISALDGTMVREIQGVGDPGPVIHWDGLDDNAGPAKGGGIYQYQFIADYADKTRSASPIRRFGLNRTSVVSVSLTGGAFVSNSATLSEKAREILTETAQALKKYPNEKIIVEGHTDSVGSDQANMELSRKRSQAAADFLTKESNIKADRVLTRWFGKTKPVADNRSAEGRELNRRVEVKGDFRQLKRPEILDQKRTEAFAKINGITAPVDQFGRFSRKLNQNPDAVEVEMKDGMGRLIQKKLILPNLTRTIEPDREIPLDSVLKSASGDGKLEVAYEFCGVITGNSRIVYDGKDVPVATDGKFSIPLRIREGDSDYWIQLISVDGFGRFVKLSTSLRRKNVSGPQSSPVQIGNTQ
jgi:outer membrane protein OmpA-like peptidoglycan-associated protein